jgi:hypothetical protein
MDAIIPLIARGMLLGLCQEAGGLCGKQEAL